MNPLTQEWAEKADEDFTAIQALLAAGVPVHNVICFHAQQCIEKYLKAWLQEANYRFSRTHDLIVLLDLVAHHRPDWDKWRADFQILTFHAVDFRYPGKDATPVDAQHAVQICTEVRRTIRNDLSLPP